jgi:DNA-binding CsgD family transcriptional regulator
MRRATLVSDQRSVSSMLLGIFLSCLFPGLAGELFPDGIDGHGAGSAESGGPSPLLETYLRLRSGMNEPPSRQSAGIAEKYLHEHPLRERTVGLSLLAVMVLLRNGRLAMAGQWSARLRAEAEAQGATSWGAFFRTAEALAALQRGDVLGAAEDARTALDSMSTRGWGIGVGLPLGVLIQAYTELDRLDEVRAFLQVPVPEATFTTTVGMYYLRARGRYHHAAGRYEAALHDFRRLGDRVAEWGVEPVSWRADAARSLLALGRRADARKLAREQSSLSAPGQHEEQAQALRLLAAAEDDPERAVALLEQAVGVLEESEKTLELAHAAADLGRALDRAGRGGQARDVLRRAQRIGGRSEVRLLGLDRTAVEPVPGGAENGTRGRTLVPAPRGEAAPSAGPPPADTPPTAPSGAGPQVRAGAPALGAARADMPRPVPLSRAEQRVAVLAARGMSNRQIARKLFITVSTVEQHLTRIYRKLNVTRRDQLALLPLATEPPPGGEALPEAPAQYHAS